MSPAMASQHSGGGADRVWALPPSACQIRDGEESPDQQREAAS